VVVDVDAKRLLGRTLGAGSFLGEQRPQPHAGESAEEGAPSAGAALLMRRLSLRAKTSVHRCLHSAFNLFSPMPRQTSGCP
jgi:hypothetical protein